MSACPGCNATTNLVWGSATKLPILQCEGCGLLFFARETMPEQPYNYQDYYEYLHSFSKEDFAYELSLRSTGNNSLLRDLLALGHSGGVMVDVGAGPGYLCKFFADHGWQVMGGEISAVAKHYGSTVFNVNYQTLESVALESVDVIVCQHVLEHIADLRSFLILLLSKLRKGGLMVVAVPHRESLYYLLKNTLYRLLGKGRRASALYYPDHLTGFDLDCLNKTLKAAGLTPLGARAVAPWHMDYDPFFCVTCCAISGGSS